MLRYILIKRTKENVYPPLIVRMQYEMGIRMATCSVQYEVGIRFLFYVLWGVVYRSKSVHLLQHANMSHHHATMQATKSQLNLQRIILLKFSKYFIYKV